MFNFLLCLSALLDLPLYRFYHFTDYAILPLVSFAVFRSRRFPALSVLTFYHFPCAPTGFAILTILPISPFIGRLVVLVSLVILFVVVMLVILAMAPGLVSLGSLSRTARQALLACLANLVSLSPHVVIAIRPVLLSLIRLWLGAARP